MALKLFLLLTVTVLLADCAPKRENGNVEEHRRKHPKYRERPARETDDDKSSSHMLAKRGDTCADGFVECPAPDSGKCIKVDYLCDVYVDCPLSFGDERGCPCLSNEWSCGADDWCILQSWVCDGEVDCLDGDVDEEQAICGEWCADGSRRLHEGEKCDHRLHCDDGGDETLAHCGFLTDTYTFMSPGFPSEYEDNSDITWVFTVEVGELIVLSCSTFNLEDSHDFLAVGEGRTPNQHTLRSFTGTDTVYVQSNAVSMWVRFKSDEWITHQGFACDVEPVTYTGPLCAASGSKLTAQQKCNHEIDCSDGSDELADCAPLDDTFELTSPNYDASYNNNARIHWVFTAEPGETLTFRCEDFHLEDGYDFLIFREGASPLTTIGNLTGSSCQDVVSSGNRMWVEFRSDSSINKKGFKGTVEVSTAPTTLAPPLAPTDAATLAPNDATPPLPTPATENFYCGYNDKTVQNKIIGGKGTVIENWPWQIVLMKQSSKNPSRYYYNCGGTLISQRHVLTAAHCVDTTTAEKLRVVLGKNDTNSINFDTDLVRRVAVLSVHPNWDNVTYDSDIAVLTLDSDVIIPTSNSDLAKRPPVNAACLSDGNDEWTAASRCFITGYGVVNETTKEVADVLQEARVTYQDAQTCLSGWGGSPSDITDNMICGESAAADDETRVDTCQGDSGGPLVCRWANSGNKYFIVGVTSWGYGCGQDKLPGVYAEVKKFLPWIKGIVSS